jgi:hypothetical protein
MLLAPADVLARLPDYPAKRITSCRGLADSEFRPRCLSEALASGEDRGVVIRAV